MKVPTKRRQHRQGTAVLSHVRLFRAVAEVVHCRRGHDRRLQRENT